MSARTGTAGTRRGRAVGRQALLVLAALAAAACAGGPAPITPADLPRLQSEARATPNDGEVVLRMAAAQQAAGDCGAAVGTARRGMMLRPQDALGPLVLGACLEEAGEVGGALAAYDAYSAAYPTTVGAPAVAARAMLARRGLALDQARQMMEDEAALAVGPADRDVVAIMPIEVVGEEQFEALSLGLAAMITSDLSLVEQLRLVERAHLDALLREIRLAESGSLDPATAARAGRLLRAGTVASGITHITDDEQMRLEINLMDPSSRIVGTESAGGRLRDLFELEKAIVLSLVERMGVQLTQAERNAILENGTRSLASFLAYSRGLFEQEAGNYAAASREFGAAVRADPGFQQARASYQETAAAPAVAGAPPGSVASLAATTASDPVMPTAVETVGAALSSGVTDVSPTLAEAVHGAAGRVEATTTSTAVAPPNVTGVISQILSFGFRIVLILP